VYRKSLRVASCARKDTTSGEIVNLMAVDCQRIADLMPYINMIWSSPLQIGVSIIMLYQILGPSVFAGKSHAVFHHYILIYDIHKNINRQLSALLL
jgi:ATP-binding cassette subfamily C (CFTR/MRP) protein 1